MLSINDFINLIDSLDIKNKGSEFVSIEKAMNRILASDVTCRYSIPRFDNSAMDGYALKAGYDKYHIIASTFAGDNRVINIINNEACKINTGSKIPKGADSVIQQELVNINKDILTFNSSLKPGSNIKFMGDDFKNGDILLLKGSKIDSRAIAILASQGINKIEVYKIAKIIIFGSGDEIVPVNESNMNMKIEDNQFFDTNSIFLKMIFRDFDCKYGGVIRDDKQLIIDTIKDAVVNYDIVITSGGASVGSKDYVYEALKELGANIIINGLNIKPGKPLKLSFIDNTFILSLPGNPIASFVTSMLIVPSIATRISGGDKVSLSNVVVTNNKEFILKPNCCNIILGNVINGEFIVFNNGKYQNSSLLPLLSSNSFAIFNNKERVLVGDKVKAIMYDNTSLDTMLMAINN